MFKRSIDFFFVYIIIEIGYKTIDPDTKIASVFLILLRFLNFFQLPDFFQGFFSINFLVPC